MKDNLALIEGALVCAILRVMVLDISPDLDFLLSLAYQHVSADFGTDQHVMSASFEMLLSCVFGIVHVASF